MQFLRTSSVSELYAGSDTADPPAPGTVTRWFLLPRGTSAAASLDPAQTWALAGYYLFLEEPLPVGGEQTFAAAAWDFLADPSFRTPRIAWFPSGVPVGGALNGYVAVLGPNSPPALGRALIVTYRNYALSVGSGVALGIDTTAPALILTPTTAGKISLTTDFGATSLTGVGAISIPLSGANSGSLQFALALDKTNGVSDLAHLDVGLRTYYPTPATGTEDGEATLVSSLRYPVFDEAQKVGLQATLAPWSVAETRSYFRFAETGEALRSCYATVTGYRADLRPYADASGPSGTPAGLVLATRASALPPSSDDLYTLIPKGDFALTVETSAEATDAPIGGLKAAITATEPNRRLMCGLSGVEYVGLSGVDALSFFTGNPAYADGFVPAENTQTTLRGDVTTAWALPSTPGVGAVVNPLTYYAQPDSAVLFQNTDGQDFKPLVYLEVGANTLPATVATTSAVPLFPYGGVSADDPDSTLAYGQLEAKVLSPKRRAVIAKTGGPPGAAGVSADFAPELLGDAAFTSVTPQGLLATFTDATLQTLGELTLAQMPDGSRFSLLDLPNGTPLRTAIASNQLFLVVSNPAAVNGHIASDPAKNRITIEGWNFQLDPSVWATTGPPGLQGTTLIFKFAAGALLSLAQDTGSWAKADVSGGAAPFNPDDAATSARIGQLMQEAIDAYAGGKGDKDFETFVQAVTDPTWQGILILNAAAPLTELPNQCKGLGAGIDPTLFYAHHIGINIAKIVQSTPLSIEPSSMFALIHYQAPYIPMSPDGAAYQFQVDSLRLLFKNSAIAGFSSTIELRIGELFGDAVNLKTAEQVVLLYGVLQRQTIAGQVYDTYLFQTAQNQPQVFPLVKGSVFSKIRIDSAQFVTQQDQSDGLTHTYFALAGLLDFTELDGLDLFSFGGEKATDVAGLNCSQLLVRMYFNPAVLHSSVFAFDATGIVFDPAHSVARADSLYQHFPLTLSGFIQADSGSSPGGIGYLGVQSPLTQTALAVPWFGLIFDLDLGTLGALAAKAGFTAKLLAAWSPSTDTPKVFLGLKLPGSDGGKGTISIEGVLNLGFRALVLGRNGPSTYYLLLNALALKFLSLTFPSGGQIDMALFGNPDDEHNSSLGWYAAYTKDQAQKSGSKDQEARTALRLTRIEALTLPRERHP